MTKPLLFMSILILVGSTCYAQTDLIHKVRAQYQKAATEEKVCENLIELLNNQKLKQNPLLLGYKGSATMMMASHVVNPFTKLSYFKEGKNMLEKAVGADHENVELRFLRYAAQKNAPSFLGYDEHIADDKKFLLQASDSIEEPLKELISSQLNINRKD